MISGHRREPGAAGRPAVLAALQDDQPQAQRQEEVSRRNTEPRSTKDS